MRDASGTFWPKTLAPAPAAARAAPWARSESEGEMRPLFELSPAIRLLTDSVRSRNEAPSSEKSNPGLGGGRAGGSGSEASGSDEPDAAVT